MTSLGSTFLSSDTLLLLALIVVAYFVVSLSVLVASFIAARYFQVPLLALFIGMFLGLLAAVTFHWWLFLPGIAGGALVACLIGILHVRYLN